LSLLLELAKALSAFSGAFKLSAFAILLFFFVVWQALKEKRVLDLLDKSLNVRLGSGQLYKLLRITAFLVFAFSIAFVVLVFIAPSLYELFKSISTSSAIRAYASTFGHDLSGNSDSPQSLNGLTKEGKIQLHNGNYAASRHLFFKALDGKPDDRTAEYLRGMVTATYYGAGLYDEGLQYLCGLYKSRAPNDTRYRFPVHALIRAISVHKGVETAEKTAAQFRASCHRSDFSEFWASIPLGLMETLHDRGLRGDWPTHLSQDEAARLEFWISYKGSTSVSPQIDFGDYALYFLGDYDQVLRRYPKSDILDAVLRDGAETAAWPTNAEYLEKYLKLYPNAKDATQVMATLAALDSAHDRAQDAFALIDKIPKEAREGSIEQLTDDAENAVSTLAASGDFLSAQKLSIRKCDELKLHSLPCGDLKSQLERLGPVVKIISRNNSENNCRLAYLEARSENYNRGAMALLDRCLPELQNNTLEYGRALYLLSSSSRRLRDYAKSEAYLMRFVREIHNHPLLDDAYAEIGWYYTVIEPDQKKAQQYLGEVVRNFAARNAYDDALWWLARGAENNGDYAGALRYYGQILSMKAQSRFKGLAGDEVGQIASLEASAPLSGLVFVQSPDNIEDVIVSRVDRGGFAHDLGVQIGDKVASICGKVPKSAEQVLALSTAVEDRDPDNIDPTHTGCTIVFKRGSKLMTYIGYGPKPSGWQLQ
jgi:tetratricopeptide (TPR) repeat protein